MAAGEKLPFQQKDVQLKGWAVEARLYAEDPYRNFLPSTGRLVKYREPKAGADVRVDSGVYEGGEISMFYDPMIAKLSTWAPSRAEAVDAMGRALERFYIEGLGHNVPFLAAVMDQERFQSGVLSTNYIKDEFPDGFKGTEPTAFQADLLAAVACAMHRKLTARSAPQLLRDEEI